MARKPDLEVADGRVIGIYYTLKDDGGNVLDSNRSGGRPMAYLHGGGSVVPGLEQALEGAHKNDFVQTDVPPADGYGDPDPEKVKEIPRSAMPAEPAPKVGDTITAEGAAGKLLGRIREIGEETVTIDFNHPLAGQTLHFEVTIAGVREATEKEREAGRPG